MRSMAARVRVGAVAALTGVVIAACGGSAGGSGGSGSSEHATLRLGYFANITHATPLVGVERGIYGSALGPNLTLQTATFNAGPAAVEALLSNSIDAAYVGPNPSVNAFVQSHGKAVRVISGATSGGASLVVRPSITSPSDLKGKTLASPQLGNTQDVALRWWLKSHGLSTDTQGGGDVSIKPQDNATALQTFRSGQIDGAWMPEPWATRLVEDGGGRVLVDERQLWSKGQFVTTDLLVRTDFLQRHRDVVARLLDGQIKANDFVNQQPAQARQLANQAIAKITGGKLSDSLVAAAWGNLSFTNDPIADSLRKSAQHAHALGLLPNDNLNGIYDLSVLNAELAKAGKSTVSS
jgi:NitT/TauT family transport system substrate-binding protein